MPARNFLKTRYRILPGQADEGDHWLGGDPPHGNATCPTCKVPWWVLWNINCRDRRFRRDKFGHLDRLPLYFCWGCVSDVAYRVQPNGRLKQFPPPSMTRPSSPPSPVNFKPRPIALVAGMPEAVREVLIKWDYQRDVMARKLSIRRRAILEEYFGHRVNASMCLFHSQFGGVPTKNWWGQETATCPNKDCPDGPNRKMSFLAGVLNDPLGGLPMVESAKEAAKGSWNFFVGVEFQICGKCYTIRACNRGE